MGAVDRQPAACFKRGDGVADAGGLTRHRRLLEWPGRSRRYAVYEKLGDVREAAVTWGKVGDILYDRGELDEALRIRKEKQLPVYEKLGDVRSAAVTWGKVGDILAKQGHLGRAIATYDTEVLPAKEALGDRRELLVSRANLALHLLARNAEGDRRRAESLLRLALQDAEAMRLPEADTIRAIMSNQGFEISSPR
ncbi:MAG: hypothetical protein AB1Z98_32360 [Nannocystaceae bacterium]